MPGLQRRQLLGSVAGLVVSSVLGRAQTVDVLPWRPDAGHPPEPITAGGWVFFTPSEAAAVEAMADRLIPPDETTPGGKAAGCAVYADRQLAGPFGSRRGLYVSAPFIKGMKNQGDQSPDGPAIIYRKALSAIDAYAKAHNGDVFAKVSTGDQDEILKKLEDGDAKLDGVHGQSFFEMLLKNIQEGFFADPIYGGNRDMCGWKMIGFPGARYDYSGWIGRHNERFPLAPVGIAGAHDWTPSTKS